MEVKLGSDVVDEVESTKPFCDYRLENNLFRKDSGRKFCVAKGVHVTGALASFQDEVLSIITWSSSKAPIWVL